MEQRFTKKDFYVGQEVYAECVNTGGLLLNRGEIKEEVVTKVGNKFVTTNKRTYLIASGVEMSDYSPNFVLWNNKDEAKVKVDKDKVFSKLISLFRLDSCSLQEQRLYKKLSLEDLQEIERIIDKGETK
jgi:hypothetical protein